jgi:RNA polymerase sigma factor (sigma-70 family)
MAQFRLKQEEELNYWNQFRQGDQTAYAALYQSYVQILYQYCSQFTVDKPLIKDCIHDLFVELWRNRKTLGDTTSVRFYLMASIKRKLVRYINTQQKNTSNEDVPVEYWHIHTPSHENDMISNEEYQFTYDHLNVALGTLPKRQREAIYLKFYMDMNNQEIAELMKINIQSVYNLVFGALTNLKRNMNIDHVTL